MILFIRLAYSSLFVAGKSYISEDYWKALLRFQKLQSMIW